MIRQQDSGRNVRKQAQIIAFVGIMEWWGELRLDGATEKHSERYLW